MKNISLINLFKAYSQKPSKNNFYYKVIYKIKKIILIYKIIHKAKKSNLFKLLKEFRLLYLSLYGYKNVYNPQINIYEMFNTNCLDIYIKYNYIIRFRSNKDEQDYISIEDSYKNKVISEPLFIPPDDVENKIRWFIIGELVSILVAINEQ